MDNINNQASENLNDTYGRPSVRKSRQLPHHESLTALTRQHNNGQMMFAGIRKSFEFDNLPQIKEDIERESP